MALRNDPLITNLDAPGPDVVKSARPLGRVARKEGSRQRILFMKGEVMRCSQLQDGLPPRSSGGYADSPVFGNVKVNRPVGVEPQNDL